MVSAKHIKQWLLLWYILGLSIIYTIYVYTYTHFVYTSSLIVYDTHLLANPCILLVLESMVTPLPLSMSCLVHLSIPNAVLAITMLVKNSTKLKGYHEAQR